MLYERYLRAYAEQFRKTDRNMWNYEDGCVLIGLRALYQATGDAFYFDVLNSFMERYIEPDGTIRRYVAEEYNLDYIPAGCALYTLYDETVASFGDDGGAYNQKDSAGFINLFGLPLKVKALLDQKREANED